MGKAECVVGLCWDKDRQAHRDAQPHLQCVDGQLPGKVTGCCSRRHDQGWAVTVREEAGALQLS